MPSNRRATHASSRSSAPLAQLDRASDYESEGHPFKSGRALLYNPYLLGGCRFSRPLARDWAIARGSMGEARGPISRSLAASGDGPSGSSQDLIRTVFRPFSPFVEKTPQNPPGGRRLVARGGNARRASRRRFARPSRRDIGAAEESVRVTRRDPRPCGLRGWCARRGQGIGQQPDQRQRRAPGAVDSQFFSRCPPRST